jgi:hypothetical protein
MSRAVILVRNNSLWHGYREGHDFSRADNFGVTRLQPLGSLLPNWNQRAFVKLASAANFPAAAPESIEAAASGIPSAK